MNEPKQTEPYDCFPPWCKRSPGDWPEHFKHENGCYRRICMFCEQEFTAHKRTPACKVCADYRSLGWLEQLKYLFRHWKNKTYIFKIMWRQFCDE